MADTESESYGRWPGLTKQALADVLSKHYRIDVTSVELLSSGQDAKARAYRVETGKSKYLVKARVSSASLDVAAAVSRYLRESNVLHVIAPIGSCTGALSAQEDGFSLTVYPFVEGRTGIEVGLRERHWRMLGSFARRLHGSRLPPDLADLLGRETYRPAEIDLVRQIDDAIQTRRLPDDATQDVAMLWRQRRDEILAIAERTEALGRRLKRRALPLVLCHADLHAWNLVIDDVGGLWVVDWDEAILAPKERDLMFVVGGIASGLVAPDETAYFFQGYGDSTVEPLALAYYRHAWATQDVGGYARRVLLAPSPGQGDRTEDVRIFKGLFEPGQIVELAHASVEVEP